MASLRLYISEYYGKYMKAKIYAPEETNVAIPSGTTHYLCYIHNVDGCFNINASQLATCTCNIYTAWCQNFRGTQFLWVDNLEHFAENIFLDQRFLLAYVIILYRKHFLSLLFKVRGLLHTYTT